ncbi:MAG TPA: protein kinase [Gemmatimonadales bacterium]|nr:protein kinase [Gemmatimonadales bacterium]
MLAALNKLGVKVFVATALVVVVALGGALFLTKRKADAAADQSIHRALTATRSNIRAKLDGRYNELEKELRILNQQSPIFGRIQAGLQTSNQSDLSDQATQYQLATGAAWVLITDASGVLRASSLDPSAAPDSLGEGALVGLALEGDTTRGLWLEPGAVGAGDKAFQAVGVPVTVNGKIIAVVVAALPIDSMFAADLKAQTNSEIVFYSLDTLGHPQPVVTTLPASVELAPSLAAMSTDSMMHGDSSQVELNVAGHVWSGVGGPLLTAAGEPLGGYVGLRDRNTELAAFMALRESFPLAFLVGIAIALIASLIIGRAVTGPVRALVQATRDVREGKFSGEIVVGTRDEIGELADAFRRMVGELREKDDLVALLSGGQGSTVQMTQGDLRLVTSGAPTPRPSSLGISLMPGQTLANRYEIKEVLGAGGMGMVFRAWDRELQEVVAIKTLKPEVMDPSSIERFKQEIRLARKIAHRNVVRNYDLGESDGMLFITMEYVEGTGLEKLLRQRGKLPIGVALTVAKQLLRALEAAHELGVIHRDIKPANIVVEPNGLVKVMDFGIARLAEGQEQEKKGLTAVGSVIGTPQYMSPEQLMAGDLDARSDLYAAGAVLYECLTGKQVFEAPTIAALIVAQVEEQPKDPRELNPAVPHDLALIVLKALAKTPQARWSSAGEFTQALDEVEVPAARAGESGPLGAVGA